MLNQQYSAPVPAGYENRSVRLVEMDGTDMRITDIVNGAVRGCSIGAVADVEMQEAAGLVTHARLRERIADLNRQEETIREAVAGLNPNVEIDQRMGYYYGGQLHRFQVEREFLASLIEGVF